MLRPEKALIFRITHRANLPFILEHGLFCRRAHVEDPNFVAIGNPELIEKRRDRTVDVSPGGTLDDYVPFYFTPCSPMLLNIKTGYVKQRSNEEIVVLVSSLPKLEANGIRYVFTDRHAYLKTARFFNDRADLGDAVDFPLLQSRDFSRDPEHPEKFERYQAEALAHHHVPVTALAGVGCYTASVRDEIKSICSRLTVTLDIVVRSEWYF
ncbi:MAG TPA: DUF4433 domain-containing protein [Thermoanaerobaculia bacterium]|nr:DUF4433 domain-containing protein [Thermoanaerobaculia bacterium]